MPKGYLIAHVTVKDAEAYKEYVLRDTPIFERFGGRFIVRGGSSQTPEGDCLERHVVIEFPSYEAARQAYDDPEYQEVADIRRRTADSVVVLVEGTG